MSINYWNGDYYNYYSYYSVNINIRCSDTPVLPSEADVYQYAYGYYVLYLDSVYACPQGRFGGLE